LTPDSKRELRALKNGAGNERRLVSAGVALKHLVRASSQNTVLTALASRAAKSCRPARLLQRHRALCLGSEAAVELRHRQAGLKLDSIHGHSTFLLNDLESSVCPAGRMA
jgi:hypothetical protein